MGLGQFVGRGRGRPGGLCWGLGQRLHHQGLWVGLMGVDWDVGLLRVGVGRGLALQGQVLLLDHQVFLLQLLVKEAVGRQ